MSIQSKPHDESWCSGCDEAQSTCLIGGPGRMVPLCPDCVLDLQRIVNGIIDATIANAEQRRAAKP